VSQGTGQATGTNAGMQYDYGSNISWTTGEVFLMWQYYTAPTNIQTWASGGMRFGIGSSSGNMRFWNAMGDDFSGSPYACWQNTAIDPEVTGDATDGSPTTGIYRYIGSLPNVRAKITKGAPHACDVVRYGRGEIYATGTGGTFAGYAAANDGSTARWGLFQAVRGGYLWKGLLSLGQSGTSVTFTDSNTAIFIDDTPRIAAGFNKIEVNNSSSSVTWTGVSITGVTTSITGSAPISAGDFEVIDNATVAFTSCTFSDMGSFIFNGGTNDNDIIACIFRRCGEVDTGGGLFDGCLFSNSEVANSVTTTDLAELVGCTFESDSSNHAIELTSIGDGTMDWDSTTTGYDSGSSGSPVTPTSTGNESLYVNVGSGTLTVNVASGATIPSIRSAGATVNVVAGQVTTTITAVNASTQAVIQYARVYLIAAAGGPLTVGTEILNAETNSSGVVTDTRSLASDQPVEGWVRKGSATTYYKTSVISATIDNATGLDLTIQMIPDE